MDTALIQDVLEYMRNHSKEPLGIYTILEGLKSEFNIPISIPVLESTLKEMQDKGYIYPAGGYWYITYPGFKTRDLKQSPASKYQQFQSNFQHVTANTRETYLDKWKETIQNYYKFFKETHPEYSKWFTYVERSKGQLDEFFKDVLALFLKWNITNEPLVKYPEEEEYNYPEGMVAIEQALEESIKRFVKYIPLHKNKIINQDTYRTALDKTKELLERGEDTIKPQLLSTFKKGSVVNKTTLNTFIKDIFTKNKASISLSNALLKTISDNIINMLTPEDGIVVVGMEGDKILGVINSFLGPEIIDVKAFNTLRQNIDIEGSIKDSIIYLSKSVSNKNFNSKNLLNINFRGLSIVNSSFIDANCSNSDWTNADLNGDDFTSTNLSNSSFKVKSASDCIFENTNFDSAELDVKLFLNKNNFGIPKNVSAVSINYAKESLPVIRNEAKNTFSHSFPLSGSDKESGKLIAEVLQKLLEGMGKKSSLRFSFKSFSEKNKEEKRNSSLKFITSSMWNELREWQETGQVPQSIPIQGLFPWLRKMKETGEFKKHNFSEDDIVWFFNAAREALKALPPKPKQQNIQQIKETENQQKVNRVLEENKGRDNISIQSLLSLITDKEGFLYSWIKGFGESLSKSEAFSILHSLTSSLNNYHINQYVQPKKEYVAFPYSTRVDPIYEGAARVGPYGSHKQQFGVVLNLDYSLLPKDIRLAVDTAMMTVGTHLYNAMSHAVVAPMNVTKVDLISKTPQVKTVWVIGEMQNDVVQKITQVTAQLGQIFKDKNKVKNVIERVRSFFRDWPENLLNSILELAGQMGVTEVWMPEAENIGEGGRNWSAYYEGAAQTFGAQLKTVGREIEFNPHGNASHTNRFYVISLAKDENKMSALKFGYNELLKFSDFKKKSEIDFLKWKAATLTYIKTFVREQMRQTPDLGTKQSLAKDAYGFMMEWLPENIKRDEEFPDLLQWLRNKLEEEGYGDILAPTDLTEEVSQDRNPEKSDEEGDLYVTPEGEPIKSEPESRLPDLIFHSEDIEEEKNKLIDKYLEELHDAMTNHNQAKINELKRKINELNSTSSLKFSWQFNEYIELKKILDENRYSYEDLGYELIINHKGNVNLPFFSSLPDNIQFNNRGNVNLPFLSSLPDNIQFNNGGNVWLDSLTTLLENIQFNNVGNIYLPLLTSLPNNKYEIFHNEGIVYYDWDRDSYTKFNPRKRNVKLKFSSEQPQFDYDYTRKHFDKWDDDSIDGDSRNMHQYYDTDLMYLEDPNKKEKELGIEEPTGRDGILPGGFAASALKFSWQFLEEIEIGDLVRYIGSMEEAREFIDNVYAGYEDNERTVIYNFILHMNGRVVEKDKNELPELLKFTDSFLQVEYTTTHFPFSFFGRVEDFKLVKKAESKLKFSFDDHTENEEYYLNMDVQPDELVQESPTVQKERYDIVKYRHDPGSEEMYFEKGLHQNLDNVNTFRPITPYGKKQ